LTLREQSKKYPFYPTQLFEAIRDIYQSIEHFDMIDDIVNHLEKIIPREIITKIHNNNPKKHRFIHAIHEYFDAFHIIKYLNKNYKVDPEKDFEHFKKFIKINFNKEIKYDKWEQIPIDELNTIRDQLYKFELNLQKSKYNYLINNQNNDKIWKYLSTW
jgi:hypothetical protein